MRKIMQDFRGFCQNKDDRLVEFYSSVYYHHHNQSIASSHRTNE